MISEVFRMIQMFFRALMPVSCSKIVLWIHRMNMNVFIHTPMKYFYCVVLRNFVNFECPQSSGIAAWKITWLHQPVYRIAKCQYRIFEQFSTTSFFLAVSNRNSMFAYEIKNQRARSLVCGKNLSHDWRIAYWIKSADFNWQKKIQIEKWTNKQKWTASPLRR